MTPTPEVLPGAEPFSAPGGPHGALVVHGFTGCPQSMRGLAEAFAAAGFAVELPLLPGHGTTLDDMCSTRWDDWTAAAERALADLQARIDRVVVAGLSMGGTIACWLAERHPEIAGLVLVNPAIDPPAESFRAVIRGMVESGATVAPAIGNDVADPSSTELAYAGVPLEPLLSFCEGQDGVLAELGEIRCPVLLFTSRADHVVPPVSSDILAERVAGPVERVFLDRSYHVATIDFDRDEIETRAMDFARKVVAG